MSLKVKRNVNSQRLALIDGDILVYRCGFAAEDSEGQAEPVENALHSVKLQIEKMMVGTDCGRKEVYLTAPKGNFREHVAVSRPYKGNRPSRKPVHYQAIRDYLTEVWGAQVVEGIEADDVLSIRKHEEGDRSIICTIDKDLDMVPGWHHNFAEGRSYYITTEQGWRCFFKQMITGDTVDNIPGIPGRGKKAATILDDVQDEREMFNIVQEMYKQHTLDDEYFNEQAILLWMLRSYEESWSDVREQIES